MDILFHKSACCKSHIGWLQGSLRHLMRQGGSKGVVSKSDEPLGCKEDNVLNETVNRKVIIDFNH